ncbi:MAG TPA: PepSY domain-containing protein [Candidatus Methylomirabilis sp.]
MKKALGVALVAVLVLGVTSMALARWGGPGMGMGFGPRGAMMGQGAGMGPGTGFGPGAGPCWQQGATGATATAIDDAKAKEIANEYLTKNLPGFSVEKIVKFDRPRGPMYQVELKGPKDEVHYLHINPFGYVMPFGAGRTF